ncbi:hypothetical protein ACOK01_09960 [Pseudosulfitobacter pseudonitzschiae]
MIASGLDYAIVRPVRLTQADGSRDTLFGGDVDLQGQGSAWRCGSGSGASGG